jgi:hypothetical protein
VSRRQAKVLTRRRRLNFIQRPVNPNEGLLHDVVGIGDTPKVSTAAKHPACQDAKSLERVLKDGGARGLVICL